MDLDQIYSILVIIAVFLGVAATLRIVYAFISVRDKYRNKPGGIFAEIASNLYEEDKFDDLIEFSNKQLWNKPNDPYAHWSLGKAHYGKEEYTKAEECFRKTVELRPLWKADWIDPYLDQMKAKRIKPLIKNKSPE